MFHVHTPEPSLGHTRFLDVDFQDGVAHLEELHPIREQALIQHGYTVIQEIVGTKLEDITVPELRQLAKDEGLELPAKARKAEIIEAISALPLRVLTAADAEGDFAPLPGSTDNGDGTFTAPGIRGDSGAAVAAMMQADIGASYIPLTSQQTEESKKRTAALLAQTTAAADNEE